jgi:hypothetical protein
MGISIQKMNIKELTTKEKLDQKLHTFTETIWEGKVQGKDIKTWLNNFAEDIEGVQSERLNSMYLLSKFMYFGNHEVREMLKSLFRDKVKYPIIHKFRTSNQDTTDENRIKRELNTRIKNSKFLGIGNPSESGIHLLYYFRQENNLPKTIFINTGDIFSKDENNKMILSDSQIDTYYFIDDFCGSGTTVVKDGTSKAVQQIKSLNDSIKIHYISLFATEGGLSKIKEEVPYDSVDGVFVLDSSYKCFDSASRYYKEKYPEIDQGFTKDMCILYKKKLKRKNNKFYNPLGFNSSQLLIGFFHNTPNNTLPIFWHAERDNWAPIFKRYPKNYGN